MNADFESLKNLACIAKRAVQELINQLVFKYREKLNKAYAETLKIINEELRMAEKHKGSFLKDCQEKFKVTIKSVLDSLAAVGHYLDDYHLKITPNQILLEEEELQDVKIQRSLSPSKQKREENSPSKSIQKQVQTSTAEDIVPTQQVQQKVQDQKMINQDKPQKKSQISQLKRIAALNNNEDAFLNFLNEQDDDNQDYHNSRYNQNHSSFYETSRNQQQHQQPPIQAPLQPPMPPPVQPPQPTPQYTTQFVPQKPYPIQSMQPHPPPQLPSQPPQQPPHQSTQQQQTTQQPQQSESQQQIQKQNPQVKPPIPEQQNKHKDKEQKEQTESKETKEQRELQRQQRSAPQQNLGWSGCQYCSIRFKDSITLSNHLSEVHRLNPVESIKLNPQRYPEYTKLDPKYLQYTCQFCGDVLGGFMREYRTHLYVNHNKNDWFSCLSCRQTFPTVETHAIHVFRKHTKIIGARRVYTCPITKIQMWKLKQMQQHFMDVMSYHFQVPDGYEKYARK